VSEHSNSGIQSFVSYLHTVLPSRIRGEITKQISSQNQVPFAEMFDYTIRNCLDQTGNEWLQGQDVQSVDHQDLTCQPWNNDLSTSWPSQAITPSSSLDQSLSFTGLGLQCLTPGNLNEMSGSTWTWSTQFQSGNVEPASVETGACTYRSADIMDFSGPSGTSYGPAWNSDPLQWSAIDPPNIILD
jgi:hypothetical protein